MYSLKLLGDFEYEYEVENKNHFFDSSLQAPHYSQHIPIVFHDLPSLLKTRSMELRTRALETSLNQRSKIVLVLNSVVVVQFKALYY